MVIYTAAMGLVLLTLAQEKQKVKIIPGFDMMPACMIQDSKCITRCIRVMISLKTKLIVKTSKIFNAANPTDIVSPLLF
jgi:chorismate mutase